MKIACVGCKKEVQILSDGKIEKHLVGPAVTFCPSPNQFCRMSGFQYIPISALSGECERCGAVVGVSIEGVMDKHYPDPHSTLSAENYCGQRERNYGSTHQNDSGINFHFEPGLHALWNP